VSQKEEGGDEEGDMENGCHDGHGRMGTPNGFSHKGDEPISNSLEVLLFGRFIGGPREIGKDQFLFSG
jgi:hypothetical protein